MTWQHVEVPLEAATDRQLLLFLVGKIGTLEDKMADLIRTVEELRLAVSGVADRVNTLVEPLRASLSDAQAALTAERQARAAEQTAEAEEDVAQSAQIAQAQADLDSALGAADSAALAIEAEVARLNEVAAAPADTPTEDAT
jgi:chromosome segregation ATPase